MSLTFHWFLPTSGDSRNITGGGHGAEVVHRDRPVTIRYLRQIASAAEELGFEGALTPTGPQCDDAWLSTASLLDSTDRLKFLVALRPGLLSPTLAAQMATTFQNQSGGRLLLNVVTGGEPSEQKAFGDFLSKDERYRRTDEFLAIVRKLWEHGDPFDFHGEHLRVEQARLVSVPDPIPQVYFGGSSAAAGPVAAARSDVYLTWGEPPADVAEKLNWIRKLAAEAGRTVRFGIRLHVITRDTSEDAWREAHRLLAAIPPETIAKVQAGLNRSESVGQRRMMSLHGGSAEDLEIYPNLWAGVGLVRGGAGTALVGSHEEVADRIKEYAALGIEEFILSGYPHLEEAYWFGEAVLPRLERDGLWTRPGND
ncbi:LLM class flavin-dependent oxidoreductase [Kribbella sp. NPDC056861]|uniref:LLM class flavin-dependent oxidoreductase n=1 Tax=Kribbella sp. NPDC056861 TaxID=3154857 RepID=UPI00341392C2